MIVAAWLCGGFGYALQIRRPTAPWLVSCPVGLNLFEPQIGQRFEAGEEEDRAVAQASVRKLDCRLAPPPRLRLCEAEPYLAQNYEIKARIQACLQWPVSSKKAQGQILRSKQTLTLTNQHHLNRV